VIPMFEQLKTVLALDRMVIETSVVLIPGTIFFSHFTF